MVMHFPELFHRHSDELAICDLDLADAFVKFIAVVREALRVTSIVPIFEGLESTLRCLEPIIKEKDLLDLPNEKKRELIELMKKGVALVCKCTTSHLIHLKKHRYAHKLRKLQVDILRIFQVYLSIRTCRDSKELLLEVKDLDLEMRKLNKATLEKVSGCGKRNRSMESCKVPKQPNFVVGLDDSFLELKGELLKGGVPVHVVSGPEGFGKTTLVKMLGHDSDIEGKFKNIFFVKVGKSPNFIAIVRTIIQSHCSGLPNIETEHDAVSQLQQLLAQIGNSPVLLILDDVPSESESLLEKLAFEKIPDYKILVTSRFEFPSFGPAHQLSRLNDEDARKLFLHSAVPQFGNPALPNEDLTEKMVELCKGSPQALTLVGKSLCGKHPSIWRSRLLEWSQDPSFLDSGGEILDHFGTTSRVERAC